MELVEWLASVLDAHERIANEAEEEWEEGDDAAPDLWVIGDYDISQRLLLITTRRAVLADIASKRAILAIHTPETTPRPWPSCSVCVGSILFDDIEWVQWPCPTVRALASAYAHCPGYQSAA